MLGRPQSPVTLQEEKSGVRRRSQGSPAYVRSKIKVRKTRNEYAKVLGGYLDAFALNQVYNNHHVLILCSPPQVTTGELPSPPSSLSLPPHPTPPSLSPLAPAILPAPTTSSAPQSMGGMVTRTGQSQSSTSGTTGTFVCQVCHES